MKIERRDLAAAAEAGIVAPAQADRLWSFLAGLAAAGATEDTPRFSFTHLLYYLGGMLAIGAMSLFMTLGWERFGGWGIFFIALLYSAIALQLANRFEAQSLALPMGIMAALIVALIPLALWGVQQGLDLWPAGGAKSYRAYHTFIDWRWLMLELGTLIGAIFVLYRYRSPFLLMPVAVTLWYMSMDVAAMLIHANDDIWSAAAREFRQWFSIAFGLIMVLVAFWVDLRWRGRRDYAFWLYLFGLLAFWCALSSMNSNQLAGKLGYLAINLALVFVGATLVRRTFTVFGAIGIVIVLADISWRFFKHSWLFPIALSMIGLAIVFAGVWFSRNEIRLTQRLQAWLPADQRELLAARHAAPAG